MGKIFSSNLDHVLINFYLIDLFDESVLEQLAAYSSRSPADTERRLAFFLQKEHWRMNHRFMENILIGLNVLKTAVQKKSASVASGFQNLYLAKFRFSNQRFGFNSEYMIFTRRDFFCCITASQHDVPPCFWSS